jgi:choice-of-anchor A domain-containing protein
MMSGGSTYVNNASVGVLTGFGSGSGTSVFAGRDVILTGSTQGSISAGTNVTIKGGSVGGSVVSGGSLKSAGSGGSISGNVTLGGTNQAGNSVSIGGSVLQNQAFTSAVNIGEYGEWFASVSRQASAAASTGTASASSSGNQLSISTSGGGTQFVRVGGAMISSARNISVSGSQDATVVVNVTGDAANFSNIGWSFAGGASAARTIFVFENASSVTVSGDVQASILASAALVQLSSANVSGTVVGMGLIGNGSLGSTQFTGAVPAPGTAALAACGALVVVRRRR